MRPDPRAMSAQRRVDMLAAVGSLGAADYALGYITAAVTELAARYPDDREVADVAATVQAYRDVTGRTDCRIIP